MFEGFKCLDPPEAVRQRISSLQSTAPRKRSYNIILGPFHAFLFCFALKHVHFLLQCCLYLLDSLLHFLSLPCAGLLHYLHICFFSQPLLLTFSVMLNICLNFTPDVSHELCVCEYMHLSICKQSLKKPKQAC